MPRYEHTPPTHSRVHLGEPVALPARGPPIEEAELDQSMADASFDDDPIPEYEFDQTVNR